MAPATGPAMGDVDVATLAFLRKALRDLQQRGDRQGYAAVLDELRDIASQHASLVSWLRAFAEVVSMLDKTFFEVVDFWLSIEWANQDDAFATLYQQFLESLISAHAVYGQAVAKMVVKSFGSSEQQWSPGSVSDRRLHHLLKRVLELVPTAPTFVGSLLAEHFPHPRAPVNSHIHYLRHAIRVLDYAPNFEKQLLSLIVDRVLQIDVHIQKDDLDITTPTEAAPQSMVFEMEGTTPTEPSILAEALSSVVRNSARGNNDDDDDDDELDSDTEGTANFAVDQNEMVVKLDALMVVLFDYLAASFRKLNGGKADKAARRRARELHSVLLNIFDKTISRSVKSRHVQFLIFYTCSFSEEFSDDFLTFLFGRMMDPSLPALNRMLAASYAGSFVARAKYLSLERVRECLGVMADWATSYVRRFESPAVAPDHRKYGVFYSIVQAILYVFVFRWRELTASLEDEERSNPLRWPRELQGIPSILNSRFRPLKIVSRGVAQEFASVVHRLELHYVNSMIERRDNKPGGGASLEHWPDATMADSSGSSLVDNDISYWAILNGFFPFDPYQLAKSASFVEGLYLEYQESAPLEVGGIGIGVGVGVGVGLRNESDSSEEDELDKLLSISMSISV